MAGRKRFEVMHGLCVDQLVERLQNAFRLLEENPPETAANHSVAKTKEVGYV